jgi:hypothetical protein
MDCEFLLSSLIELTMHRIRIRQYHSQTKPADINNRLVVFFFMTLKLKQSLMRPVP